MNRPHPLSKLRKIKMNSTKTKSSRTSRFQSLTPRILLSLSYDTLTAHLLLRPLQANLGLREAKRPGQQTCQVGGGRGGGVVALPSFRLGESGKT